MPLAVGPVGPVATIAPHQLLVFLLQVGLLLLLAFALGRLAARFGLPAIVGELCAGVLAGPSVLGQIAPGLSHWLLPHDASQLHLLDAVGQIGVILLVGLTGIHLDLKLIRRRGITAARISSAGVVLPVALGIATGFLFPASMVPRSTDRTTFALFLGVALGVSAIPVIAKTLSDMGLLHRNVGQLTLCSVMVDDAVGWLLLSVVSAMATTHAQAGDIALSVGCVVGVCAFAILVRPVVRRMLEAAERSPESGATIAVVTILMLLSAAATQAMKLEAVFGVFVCGIVIGDCGVSPARLAPLRTVVMTLLAPLFFATVGLRMDLTALGTPSVLLAGVAVLIAAIVGKFAGAYVGARLSRLGHWEGLALGAGMNARGVIGLIIAMVGLRLGVLSPGTYTIVVLVAIVTSLMAPVILRWTMTRVEHTAEERLREESYEVELA